MKKHHRFVALLLAAVMSVSMIPAPAFAAEAEETVAVTETVSTEYETEEVAETENTESEGLTETIEETDYQETETALMTEEHADIEETESGESETEETVEETETEETKETETEETETEETETEEIIIDKKETAGSGVSKYSYKSTPLLAPFNEYFYVETNNPDPLSFKFVDKSSIYGEDASILFEPSLYADVHYENTQTARVKGGYIFCSSMTDGGELILQEGSVANWKDTKVKVQLPALMDVVDYLIKTYAKKNSFFDNMDAIQSGFQSICFYSGSYIRGRLTKPDKYWSLAASPHRDQSFYIYSPYSRENNESLFASAIYPYRYDSIGFPSVMAAVSKRLDSASSCKWDDYIHAYIQVTYKGETRTYGGQGNPEGQGITKDKILRYFDFSKGAPGLSIKEAKSLLNQYAEIKMEDDIPRKDALTWEKIYKQVGTTGSWARISDSTVYTYFYQSGNRNIFDSDEFGVGNSLYWGGDLGYARDSWVDGRYVDKIFIPGEKFEDHPESDIILIDTTVPQVSYSVDYEWDWDSSKYKMQYSITGITEIKKTARFIYDSSNEEWCIDSAAFNQDYANYYDLKNLVNEKVLDKKYLDMVTLTKAEVRKLQIDKNTNIEPLKGLIYDGTVTAGTPFDNTGKKDISKVAVSGLNKKYIYTGKAIKPSITVKDGSKTLSLGKDYKVAYSDNKNVGTASMTITGIGGYYKEIYREFEIVPADEIWQRLAGAGRYDTMQAIVKEGFSKSGGTVIIATGTGFKDALAAAGLAGLYDAPVILTDGKNLSSQAKAELTRLKPKKIYIAGGTVAVSDNVKNQIMKATNITPARLAGQNSSETSAKLALAGKGKWSSTAVIATNKSFKDALSVAPLAYANNMPILLADNGQSVSKAVLKAMKDCGIKNVIIVGGTAAVTKNVESQLTGAGFKITKRLWGNNGVATSAAIAKYGISNLGMSADQMGVATSQNYPDALAGAAFCGSKNSVLILADDKATANTSFPAAYKNNITKGYIFGGPSAVGEKTVKMLTDALK